MRHHKDDRQYLAMYTALRGNEHKTAQQENVLRYLNDLEIIQAGIGNAADLLAKQTEAISTLIVKMVHDIA